METDRWSILSRVPFVLPLLQLLTPEQGRLAFVLFFAFANGPLGWSVIILQNRLGMQLKVTERGCASSSSVWACISFEFIFAASPLLHFSVPFSITVFHSVEHSSSLFVHMSPILVTWAMRWNGTLTAPAHDQEESERESEKERARPRERERERDNPVVLRPHKGTRPTPVLAYLATHMEQKREMLKQWAN